MLAEQHIGRYSFVKIDIGEWVWAIVIDYQDGSNHGDILCGFHEELLPEPEHIDNILYLASRLEWEL